MVKPTTIISIVLCVVVRSLHNGFLTVFAIYNGRGASYPKELEVVERCLRKTVWNR